MVAVGSGYYQQEPQADLGTYETPEEGMLRQYRHYKWCLQSFNKRKANQDPRIEIEKQTTQVFNINQL
jgi:hypothetical protein